MKSDIKAQVIGGIIISIIMTILFGYVAIINYLR